MFVVHEADIVSQPGSWRMTMPRSAGLKNMPIVTTTKTTPVPTRSEPSAAHSRRGGQYVACAVERVHREVGSAARDRHGCLERRFREVPHRNERLRNRPREPTP